MGAPIYSLGVVSYSHGRIQEALAYWRGALRVQPDYVPASNRMAWVLATSLEAAVRDGAEAIKLGERAVRLSGGREAAILDTLAVAYAEVSRFLEAVQTINRALALAKQQPKTEGFTEELKATGALYQRGTSLRETQPSVVLPGQ